MGELPSKQDRQKAAPGVRGDRWEWTGDRFRRPVQFGGLVGGGVLKSKGEEKIE